MIESYLKIPLQITMIIIAIIIIINFIVIGIITTITTVKILKFGTPQTIAIIVLKIEKFDVTLH